MLVRRLETIDECRQVAALERLVWGYADAEDVVPPPVLMISVKRGGILLGAFDAGVMKGFVYSIPGIKNGRVLQWSHMLGVAPDARERGVALQLKLAQRNAALTMGIDLVEWTCDPLQAANAHLNFARLGVVVSDYQDNIYGESSSPLHHGVPTDRFVAEWHLTRPHVERRIQATAGALIRDSSIVSAPVINPSSSVRGWLRPGRANLDVETRRMLIEIPTSFTQMLAAEPALALEWRLETRAIFTTFLGRGYRAVDFFLDREAGKGQYLLALPNEG